MYNYKLKNLKVLSKSLKGYFHYNKSVPLFSNRDHSKDSTSNRLYIISFLKGLIFVCNLYIVTIMFDDSTVYLCHLFVF